jgi:transcriptional antiterminator NusG
MIFVAKVTTNKEDQTLDLIVERVKRKSVPVFSIAHPHGLRGYILIEAENRENAELACYNLPYVKGLLSKTINLGEMENLVEPEVSEINIEKGDIVEIIAEPFKKEKAKVIRIDKSKEEAVVELLEAAIPIPVTVKIDNIRTIRRDTESKEEKK